MKRLLLAFALTLNCAFFQLLADSPLTSTDFSVAYKNESIVKKAKAAKGALNAKLMKFLTGTGPIAVKMAVINTLSWDMNGKNNAGVFMEYLMKTKKYSGEDDLLARASADEILCLAYLKALDNYFDVATAAEWSAAALKKNPSSYTFNIIDGLIQAQLNFDVSWCAVYKCTDTVRQNTSLNIDMNEEAIRIIFDYMDLYAPECDEVK